MNTDTATIAAIATGAGNAGISVIRVSGSEALRIVSGIFRPKRKDLPPLWEVQSHTVHYGYIADGERTVDEVLLIIMKAPASYTKEDVVEIDCHGGIAVTRAILNLVIKNGARPAMPGEFTKRAFLNGRIDLSQAEAVMDLIEAQNDYAIQSSVNQLKGKMSEKIREVREIILEGTARIESALDDPEHMSLDGYGEILKENVVTCRKQITELLRSAENGRLLTQGIRTVIMGRPNAGKSSLMNSLLGDERSIVTDIAGTTRDALEETISLDGILLKIIDTAGIRVTNDPVEKIGVEIAKKYAGEADLILYVVDASVPFDSFDKEEEGLLDLIRNKKVLFLLNKTDLESKTNEEEIKRRTGSPVLSISIKKQTGLDELLQLIKEMFFHGEITFNDEVYITNARHKEALGKAAESLDRVLESMENQMPEDFYSIDLMDAYEILGTMIGESVGEDLADMIFSRFCMGK